VDYLAVLDEFRRTLMLTTLLSALGITVLDPEAERWAQSVVEEADRLTRTVSRDPQFVRGETGPSGPGDAGQALHETLDLLEGEFRARRATLTRPEGPPAGLPVRLDNESLKQIVLNLMLDALGRSARAAGSPWRSRSGATASR
jgi:C4-dicarboxylate-specific signal transduction histidine kinase